MKTKQLFISLALGLGLTLAQLWLLGDDTPFAHADSPHYVAPDCTGVPAPCHTAIQEAVDAAVPGDEILVATGTYTDVNVRPRSDFITTGVVTQVVYISKTVTVRGGYSTTNWTTPYPITQPTTLDAQGQGRVLYITGVPSASSGQAISPTIEGLRITGGNATGLGGALGNDAGGGVYVISATATISKNQMFSNTAEYGGGLFLGYGDDATLGDNTVFSNTATQYGGGLCLGYSDATLSGNTVFSNTAVSGGGLGLGYSGATLSGNTVFSNTVTLYGGGLFLGDSPATFSDNAINGNTADAGGGLYLTGSDATLSSNTISDNTAETGGGLYLTGSDTTLTNNVVADNEANSAGSGLYILQSSPRLLHITIAHNAGGDGSGVYVAGGSFYSTVVLTNTILVSHGVGITVTGGNTVTVNGVLWYATPVTVSQAATATVTVQNQHEGNPAFAADGYHLTGASAAINQAVNAGVTTDIDDDARPDGCFSDIGADEFVTGVECKGIYLPLIMRQYP